jgi:uncharacterized protein (TIGR02001 family)
VLALGLRAALGAALFLVCCGVSAQTGGSVAFLSDYRYRGVSFSHDRPTFRLGVVHDAASGWYAGGSIIGVSLDPGGRQLQVIGYLGRSGKLSERLGWDAGATVVHFGSDSQFDYHEWFTGVQGERWNARLHYAPDYFGSGTHTAYGELNAGLPLSRFMRATAHMGALKRVGGTSGAAERWNRDAALGLAMACDAWDLQLDWTVGSRSGVYPVPYGHVRGVLVLSASYAF